MKLAAIGGLDGYFARQLHGLAVGQFAQVNRRAARYHAFADYRAL